MPVGLAACYKHFDKDLIEMTIFKKYYSRGLTDEMTHQMSRLNMDQDGFGTVTGNLQRGHKRTDGE